MIASLDYQQQYPPMHLRNVVLTTSRFFFFFLSSIVFLESAVYAKYHWNFAKDIGARGIGGPVEGEDQFGGDFRNPVRRGAY
jgi:hypothetical protein